MTNGCEHEHRVYCQRTFSNQSIHVGTMCLNCGDFRAMKKENIPLPGRNNLREYDSNIKDTYYARQRSRYQMEAEQLRESILEENRHRMNEYYSSPEWAAKRSARLQLNSRIHFGLCETCSKARATTCHHITYERFGNEWMFDLAAICSDCHDSYHPHMSGDQDAAA